jgi:hypothetical protein
MEGEETCDDGQWGDIPEGAAFKLAMLQKVGPHVMWGHVSQVLASRSVKVKVEA